MTGEVADVPVDLGTKRFFRTLRCPLSDTLTVPEYHDLIQPQREPCLAPLKISVAADIRCNNQTGIDVILSQRLELASCRILPVYARRRGRLNADQESLVICPCLLRSQGTVR